MAATDPISPEPRRFSIRLPRPASIGVATVVLVVVAVGLQVGLPIYRQRVAIREIERLGGIVETEPGGPEWLWGFMGDDRMKVFDDAVHVNLQDTNVDDIRAALLANLPRLEYLNLRRTAITGDTLSHLRYSTRLKWLGLGGTSVRDDDLVYLQGKNLSILDLSGTLVTDAGMKHLCELSGLHQLGVFNTHVTDNAISDLERAFPRLRVLRE